MEAIVAGDVGAAGRASDALLDYVEAFTRSARPRDEGDSAPAQPG